MIEDFAKLIPESLMNKSGKVFDSGRLAFESPSYLYILGDRPGGNSEEYGSETIAWHTNEILNSHPENWSAYRDEKWAGKPPGSRPMQKRMQYLFNRLSLSPGEVPCSNLIFLRWERAEEPGDNERRRLALECWPFHQAVIDKLKVRVIVCLRTGFTGKWVSSRLGAQPTGDKFTEDNNRHPSPWTSLIYRNADGLYVVALSYPAVADWTNPATDSTELVLKALERVRNSQ